MKDSADERNSLTRMCPTIDSGLRSGAGGFLCRVESKNPRERFTRN